MRGPLLALVVLLTFIAIAPAQEGRLVVLGFDGLDFRMTQRLIEEGELPNLARLAEEGEFRKLATTNPAISPVSWSALTTGRDPGRTGIDGFLRRDFGGGRIKILPALVEKEVDRTGLLAQSNRRLWLGTAAIIFIVSGITLWRQERRRRGVLLIKLGLAAGGFLLTLELGFPDGMPRAINLRQEPAFWELLDDAGVTTATMLAPCSFPAPELAEGRLLAGLGTPDARGTFGYWTVYRDDIDQPMTTETGGTLVPIVPDGTGGYEPIVIEGPPNVVSADGTNTATELSIRVSDDARWVKLSDGEVETSIQVGRWSGAVAFQFSHSFALSMGGVSYFKLLESEGRLKLYLDPISLDPRELPYGVALSRPLDYAEELVDAIGPYETVGWACATNALKDAAIDELSFLEDAERVWEDQENLALHELKRRDAKVLTCVITVPDRIQHMFQRHVDSKDETLDLRIRDAVFDAYRRVDHFVGLVRERHLDPEDELLVVSDHGMATFRRAVNLNALLAREGLLVLKQRIGPRKLDSSMRAGVDMAHIDWSRTKAYAMGLGRIYLNRKGREPDGIVEAKDADAIIEQIRGALLELRDGEDPVVASASLGSDIHPAGAIPGGAADVYVGFHRGYRVSWQTCLGGVDEPIIFDNRSAWSGDHCSVDPDQVPGVLFSTLSLEARDARVVDVTPTILDWAGLSFDARDERDGASLLAEGR